MLLPVPVFLTLLYQPLIPIYLDPVVLAIGCALILATRLNHKLEPTWGKRYYLFSAILRPLGIIVLSWGWLEILAWDRSQIDFFGGWQKVFIVSALIVFFIAALRRPVFLPVLVGSLLAMAVDSCAFIYSGLFLASFIFGLASIIRLGIRPSLLFRRQGDPIITSGPYALIRHPQLLSALAMAFFASWMRGSSWGLFNCALLGFMIVGVIWYEERDLKISGGDQPGYKNYLDKVPRLFPTFRWMFPLLFASTVEAASLKTGKIGTGPKVWLGIKILLAISLGISLGYLIGTEVVPSREFNDWKRHNFGVMVPIYRVTSEALCEIYDFQMDYHRRLGTYFDGKPRLLDSRLDFMNTQFYTWFVGPGYVIPPSTKFEYPRFNLLDSRLQNSFPYTKVVLPTQSLNVLPVSYDDLQRALKEIGRLDLLPQGDKDHFVSLIAMNIDDDPCLDIWYITEKNEMLNVLNDLDTPCKWDPNEEHVDFSNLHLKLGNPPELWQLHIRFGLDPLSLNHEFNKCYLKD